LDGDDDSDGAAVAEGDDDSEPIAPHSPTDRTGDRTQSVALHASTRDGTPGLAMASEMLTQVNEMLRIRTWLTAGSSAVTGSGDDKKLSDRSSILRITHTDSELAR
jgi:hypothetical protein